MTTPAEMLQLDDGSRLAFCHRPGVEPGVLFCPGFHSNMRGEKALARPARVHALAGIASAPDFTRVMARKLVKDGADELLDAQGYIDMPSHYPGESTYRIETGFLEEAEQHCLLDQEIPLQVPVRLLHGQADEDVPWQLSITLAERLATPDVQVHLVKDGDHRLSRPEDIGLLIGTLEALLNARM